MVVVEDGCCGIGGVREVVVVVDSRGRGLVGGICVQGNLHGFTDAVTVYGVVATILLAVWRFSMWTKMRSCLGREARRA